MLWTQARFCMFKHFATPIHHTGLPPPTHKKFQNDVLHGDVSMD